ncbi:hypothetical protein L1987_51451 [Smallanthus sonchifolius]|uniref:Uncharacterized protein n=1 Tax=Smallanthus sonchifolius TaxID=185202 RepID=A0ACB9EQY9_9ASTR|nr:hypothetical protein L1987_51451 [Smallanthus sonchifolius]
MSLTSTPSHVEANDDFAGEISSNFSHNLEISVRNCVILLDFIRTCRTATFNLRLKRRWNRCFLVILQRDKKS